MKTKYISKAAAKCSWKNAILLAVTALALCASPGARADQVCTPGLDTSWANTGTDDWFISSNWCNGVPICHSLACISNGGAAQISSTDPVAYACETFLGQNACTEGCSNSGQSGNLYVNGGTLNTCNELHVGYSGNGTLKITNGGVVNTTFGADIGAATATANGAVTVDGTNSTWMIGLNGTGNLYVGGEANSAGGTGLLQVTNGATVNAASVHVYKSGTVSGNSKVKATNGTTVDGTLAPNWTLTIDGDLIFSNAVATPLMQCNVVPANSGNDAHVTGAATLTGKLSVTMTGTFTCGTTYTLLHADNGLGNTFFQSVSINFPTGQNFTPQINYDYVHNNVNLYLGCNTN